VLERFLGDLQADPLVKEPLRIHRDAILEWNRHAGVQPDWPTQRLAVPDRSRGFALPRDALPASLTADLDGWHCRLAGEDLLGEGDFRPLRPASLATRRRQIRLLVSATVRSGVDPATLRGLADMVTPENVARGLTFLMERAGGKPTLHTGQIAGLACAIARHHVGAAPEQLARLNRIRRKATPPAAGLTPRNRERLRPFDDRRHVRAFLSLPLAVRDEVRRAGRPTLHLARLLRNAVAMEVLIMAPIRLKNLRSLRLGGDLLRDAGGRRLTLALEPGDTKNRQAFEAALPAETGRLIDLYLARYQPLLCRARCDWLFPNEAGEGPMSEDGLRQALEDFVRDRLGLVVNPHLYRHIAAKLILDHQPGAYGHARLTLGHKSVDTTTSFYAGMETRAALQRYDEIVQGLRGEAKPAAARPRAGRGRRGW
jgi:integrase